MVPLPDDPLEVDDYIEVVKGYTSNQRGKYSMVDQRGFQYYYHSECNKGTRWRCKFCNTGKGGNIKCFASAYTIKNKIVQFRNSHNHPPCFSADETHFDLTPTTSNSLK